VYEFVARGGTILSGVVVWNEWLKRLVVVVVSIFVKLLVHICVYAACINCDCWEYLLNILWLL